MEKKITEKQPKPQKTEADKTEADKTEADKIWEVIKDVNLDIFALPNQKVHDYFTPISIEPSKLYLLHKVSSALPALEESLVKRYVEGILSTKYVVSTTAKYVVVNVEE